MLVKSLLLYVHTLTSIHVCDYEHSRGIRQSDPESANRDQTLNLDGHMRLFDFLLII